MDLLEPLWEAFDKVGGLGLVLIAACVATVSGTSYALVTGAIKKAYEQDVANWISSQVKAHWGAIFAALACMFALNYCAPGHPFADLALLSVWLVAYLILNSRHTRPLERKLTLGPLGASYRVLFVLVAPLLIAVHLPLDRPPPPTRELVSVIMPPAKRNAVDDEVTKATFNTLRSALYNRWPSPFALKSVDDDNGIAHLRGMTGRNLANDLQTLLGDAFEPKLVAYSDFYDRGGEAFALRGSVWIGGDTAADDREIRLRSIRYPDSWAEVAMNLVALKIAESARSPDLSAETEKEIADNFLDFIRTNVTMQIDAERHHGAVEACLAAYIDSMPQECSDISCVASAYDDLTKLIGAIRVKSDGQAERRAMTTVGIRALSSKEESDDSQPDAAAASQYVCSYHA